LSLVDPGCYIWGLVQGEETDKREIEIQTIESKPDKGEKS